MSKNLYQVIDTITKQVIETGFSSKQDAKAKRNELNTEHKVEISDNNKPRFVVARGFDHFRGETNGGDVFGVRTTNRKRKNK